MSLPKSESWGLGAAKLVARATRAAEEVVVSISDIHYPHHDRNVLISAFNLIEAIQPHRLIINGDTNDFFGTSSHNKTNAREDTLQSEINGGNNIRAEARRRAPNALIDENEGNHDAYIEKYVRTKAGVLKSLDGLNPNNMFHWAENEITPHGRNGFRLRPHVLVKHGDLVRGESGATAKGEYTKTKITGVTGHTHRLGRYRSDGYKVEQWYEQGCLCRLDPEYLPGIPNWQHGLVVMYLSTKTDAVKIDFVETFNGKFHYGGKTF